jgi:hypothetical protein
MVSTMDPYGRILGFLDRITENTETLIDASKKAGPEINILKTKYMLLSHYQNVCQNRDIKCVTVQIFGDDSNKTKFDSGGN